MGLTPNRFTRMAALGHLWKVSHDDIVVATCALTSRELAAVGHRPNHLYVLNAMGSAVPIGLGLALGTGRRTWVIEGDGGLLMGLNALATVGYVQPPELRIVVLDNGAFCSTGCQETAAARVDLGACAEGLGIPVLRSDDEEGFVRAVDEAVRAEGTRLVHARIGAESAPDVAYLQADPAAITHDFVRWLDAST
ncbi:MAG: thiamine pyrophosphate-dependent enzyme [Longimicrobiales bacterium]|nr:thiamine pyrophosphate-dependent enzyme [Longimicrobiales bacterium]